MVFYEFINMPLALIIPYTIAFIALLTGSYTDFRTREVPDWANFGLIAAGFGINLLLSVIYWEYSFILNSIAGFGIFFAIAWIMFYTGQWGGGDSKILMGLGAVIGIDIFSGKIPFLADFLINALIIGALYGILWSFFLIAKNSKKFVKSFRKLNSSKRTILAKKIVLALFFVFILAGFLAPEAFLRLISVYLALITALTFYLWLAVKAVEDSCMLKFVKPQQLTEGDWIAKDIKISGKYIAGPKDLGIEKKQIRKLMEFYRKRKIKNVLIKEGVPFVPSFFVAYIITLVFGNLVFLFF
ncbi:prepilin peptidase [Candidatus Woesearchaeota archaeon]|nr:prepilin peptidase [Candidatus Woesearchaeota archaeon]